MSYQKTGKIVEKSIKKHLPFIQNHLRGYKIIIQGKDVLEKITNDVYYIKDRIYSKKLLFSHQIDILAIKNHKIIVIDIKTISSIEKIKKLFDKKRKTISTKTIKREMMEVKKQAEILHLLLPNFSINPYLLLIIKIGDKERPFFKKVPIQKENIRKMLKKKI